MPEDLKWDWLMTAIAIGFILALLMTAYTLAIT